MNVVNEVTSQYDKLMGEFLIISPKPSGNATRTQGLKEVESERKVWL